VTEAAPLDIAGGEDENTPWRPRAACRGQDSDLWFPPKGQTAKAGRTICAACPVLVQCLEDSVATQPEGMWGGASKRQRRRLRIIWFQRSHAYRSDCSDPDCKWCRTVDAHLRSLTEPQGPQDINGAGARHGFKATYARGCRCECCRLTVSAQGSRIRLAGFTVHWWVQWFGPRFEDRLLWYAERLVDPDEREEAVAS
jgi:WhiB family transcriptional regulator, redox-sensing transcriptional regulator